MLAGDLRSRLVALALALGAVGCGGDPTYSAAGFSVTARDQIYQSRPTGRFCDGIASNQVLVKIVDFFPACPADRKAGDADPYDQSKDHAALNILLSFGGNPMYLKNDFVFDASATCDGGGASAIAWIEHTPAGPPATPPDHRAPATKGTIKVTQYDASAVNPLNGSFDLTFGADAIRGPLNAFSCNL